MKMAGALLSADRVRMRVGESRTDDGMIEKLPARADPAHQLPGLAAVGGARAEDAAFAAILLGGGHERHQIVFGH